MTSIFARNISEQMSYTPHELISPEVKHLKGLGQSRWKTNPLMAAVRTTSGLLFVALLALYFIDPFLFAIHKTRTIGAYLYLTRFGNAADVEPLRLSGLFTERDWQVLKLRGQMPESDMVKSYYVGTSEALGEVNAALVYMAQLKALEEKDMDAATALTKLRIRLFRSIGIVPPQQWEALNPVLEMASGG